MDNEPQDLVLEQLRAMRAEMAAFREQAHNDMLQVKARLTAVEKQLINLGEAGVAQWENFDKHEERLYKLEHPTA